MKLNYSSLLAVGLLASAFGNTSAYAATVVTFETPGNSVTYQGNPVSDITSITNGINSSIPDLVSAAPSVYVSAGTAQTIRTAEATFNGGVLLGLATFFPAQTFASGLNVYGTADFGIGLNNNITFTTNQKTSEVSFALFNGETFTESYNIQVKTSDNQIIDKTINNIAANWQSGYALVDLIFPSLADANLSADILSVSISSALTSSANNGAFDFLIDSVVFNGTLPGATSPSLYTPPTPTYVPNVDPASPIIVKAPELQLPDNKVEVVDYGTDQKNDKNIEARILVSKQQQVKEKGNLVFDANGDPVFETVWELEDPKAIITLNATLPVSEPESYAMMLAGAGVMGFVARRRRLVS